MCSQQTMHAKLTHTQKSAETPCDATLISSLEEHALRWFYSKEGTRNTAQWLTSVTRYINSAPPIHNQS